MIRIFKVTLMRTPLVPVLFALGFSGCAVVSLPPGQENQREFVQETKLSLRDAYRIVSKQMKACYRGFGLLGNGYDIQADLDSGDGSARVELYYVGLSGATKPEDSVFSRTVTIRARDAGSVVTTTGTTPRYVYINHLAVASWLSGNESCGVGDQGKK